MPRKIRELKTDLRHAGFVPLQSQGKGSHVKMHYSMIIEWSDEDQIYVVSLPEWGKYAQTHGATYDEAVRNGQEVLHLLIDGAHAAHEPLPAPHVFARAS